MRKNDKIHARWFSETRQLRFDGNGMNIQHLLVFNWLILRVFIPFGNRKTVSFLKPTVTKLSKRACKRTRVD